MRIFGFLFDPDSKFAKVMSKIELIVVSNLLFLVFSIPMITAGAAYTALYHVMMKSFRSREEVKAFSEFWNGFKNNFVQATIGWFCYLLFLIVGVANIHWCMQIGGLFLYLKFGFLFLEILAGFLVLFLMPVIAAFDNKLKILFKNTIFLAGRKPLVSIGFFLVNIVPLTLAILDKVNQTTYAFCYFFFGFGLSAWIGSWLILKTFTGYLPKVEQTDKGE